MLAVNELDTTGEQSPETQERIAQALNQILQSPKFKDSQQLQSLLRYVVEESVKGHEDGLKERIIGIYVFGRRPDYDTTGDPIVRSRMGLLRKRLAQYYESDVADEASVQIVIPSGTYRPAFLLRPQAKEPLTKAALVETKFVVTAIPPVSPEETTATLDPPIAIIPVTETDPTSVVRFSSEQHHFLKAAIAAVVFALVSLGLCWSFLQPQRNALEALWSPVVKGKQPIYIYTGTMPVYEPGSPPDEASSATDLYWPIRVPDAPRVDLPETGPERVYSYGEGMLTGSVYADVRVSAFLYKYGRTPVLRTGPNLPYMDLKGSPLILIGSFDNYWTRVMNESLPFYFDRGFGIRERDGAHRRWYNPLKAEMTPRMMDDYALIFRVMDSKAGAPVLAIAGLSTCGTHAAADFVTDPTQMKALANISRADLKNRNIELVLHTSLVNCAPTSVTIIASKVW